MIQEQEEPLVIQNEGRLGAMDVLHRDVIEIKAVLRELTLAITKLAVVEERQTQISASMERAFTLLDGLERRIAELELQSPVTKRITRLVDLLMLGAVVIITGFILKHVGLG